MVYWNGCVSFKQSFIYVRDFLQEELIGRHIIPLATSGLPISLLMVARKEKNISIASLYGGLQIVGDPANVENAPLLFGKVSL